MHFNIHSSKNQISCILICIFRKEQNQKFIFKQVSCILTCVLLKKITFYTFVEAFFKKNKQKEKFMHCHAFNIHLSTRKIKLHANQQKIL